MQAPQITPPILLYTSSWTWSRSFNFGLGYRGLALIRTLPMGHHEGHSEKLNHLGRRLSCSRTMSSTSSWGSSRIETFWAIPTIDDGMTLVGMNDSRYNWSSFSFVLHLSLQWFTHWHSFILSSFNLNEIKIKQDDCELRLICERSQRGEKGGGWLAAAALVSVSTCLRLSPLFI